MRTVTNLSVVILAALLAMVALLTATCGGKSHKPSVMPGAHIGQPEPSEPAEMSLHGALAELDACPCPEGVDDKLWGELKDALEKGLIHQSLSGEKAGRASASLSVYDGASYKEDKSRASEPGLPGVECRG